MSKSHDMIRHNVRTQKRRALIKALGSALGCGVFMFLAWSALFPSTLKYDNFLTKIFVFILCILFDLIFCLTMFGSFIDYKFWSRQEKDFQ